MFTPIEKTRVGLAYRSKITHNLSGKNSFLRLDNVPTVKSQLISPQTIILSGYHEFNEKVSLVSGLGWNNWAQLKNSFIQIHNISLVTAINWRDTYRIGAGLEYHYRPQLKFQAGISYDSSPTNRAKRKPDLPIDEQIRLGTGLIYTTTKQTKVGVQAGYVNFGKAPIHQATRQGT